MRYCLNYSGTLGFCPLKIKITQFPNGFCLKFSLISPPPPTYKVINLSTKEYIEQL